MAFFTAVPLLDRSFQGATEHHGSTLAPRTPEWWCSDELRMDTKRLRFPAPHFSLRPRVGQAPRVLPLDATRAHRPAHLRFRRRYPRKPVPNHTFSTTSAHSSPSHCP